MKPQTYVSFSECRFPLNIYLRGKIQEYWIYGGSSNKESAWNTEDSGSIAGSGRSPGGWQDNPLKYSCLKNPMDRGFWQTMVPGLQRVTQKSVTEQTYI